MNKQIVVLYVLVALLLSVMGGMVFAFYTEVQNDRKFLCEGDNSAHFLYRMESDKTPWATLDESAKDKWRVFAKTRMKGSCK